MKDWDSINSLTLPHFCAESACPEPACPEPAGPEPACPEPACPGPRFPLVYLVVLFLFNNLRTSVVVHLAEIG